MGLTEWLARRDVARQQKIKSASLQSKLDAQSLDKELREARQQKKYEEQIVKNKEELRQIRPSGSQKLVSRVRGFATGLRNKLNEGKKEGHFKGIEFGSSKSSSPFMMGGTGRSSAFDLSGKKEVARKKRGKTIIIKL